jgi:hypothetical protein
MAKSSQKSQRKIQPDDRNGKHMGDQAVEPRPERGGQAQKRSGQGRQRPGGAKRQSPSRS